MSEVFKIKSGDTSPAIAYVPSTTETFAGASVVFSAKDNTGAVIIDDAAASIVTIDGATALQYNWAIGDTASLSAISKCEFTVTYADATTETFPNNDYIVVSVLSRI